MVFKDSIANPLVSDMRIGKAGLKFSVILYKHFKIEHKHLP